MQRRFLAITSHISPRLHIQKVDYCNGCYFVFYLDLIQDLAKAWESSPVSFDSFPWNKCSKNTDTGVGSPSRLKTLPRATPPTPVVSAAPCARAATRPPSETMIAAEYVVYFAQNLVNRDKYPSAVLCDLTLWLDRVYAPVRPVVVAPREWARDWAPGPRWRPKTDPRHPRSCPLVIDSRINLDEL